jgi:hypothetical protein
MEVSHGRRTLGAARRCLVPDPAPNQGVQPTAYSVRSYVAPASSGG